MTRLVYVDVETDGLGPKRQPWEIAWIIDDGDGAPVERREFLWIDVSRADPAALRIGGYWERHPDPYGADYVATASPGALARDLARDLHGATLVGANPAFDAEVLSRLLRRYAQMPTWHYRLLDVQAMCAGALGWETPRGLDDCLAALGIVRPEVDRHTALGDARAVAVIYRALRELAWRWQVIAAETALPEETIGVLRAMRGRS